MRESIWRTDGGVYFGVASEKSEGHPPPFEAARITRYVGDRHLITVGPNGSGKSRRLLLPNLAFLNGWSMLIVDPKGELAHMTAERRRAKGSRIVCLNPFDAFGIPSDGFNPVASLDPDHPDFPDDAMGLAEALIRVEGKEPHFSQSAQDLVCALIMYVRLVLPSPSLVDVRTLLGWASKEFRQLVTGIQVEYGGRTVPGMLAAAIVYECPELEAKAGRFADLDSDSRELLGVISTALTQTRWLDSRPVKADLQKGGFDFGTMKDTPTSVFLILPARRLVTHSTWLRLMITSVLQPLMKDTTKPKVPTMLMLDEFAQLGHLPVIEQTVGLMRGYGIKMWAVFQDFAQAKAIYGDRWPSFLANAGVLQAFAPQDVMTANDLSAEMGQTTRYANSASGAAGSVNFSTGPIPAPFIFPQELRTMDDGFSILRSHKAKGPVRTFLPYPKEVPDMLDITSRDPSN